MLHVAGDGRTLQAVAGIDVGYTATRRSTGVVVLHPLTLFVDTADRAVSRLLATLAGQSARIAIDGPFLCGPRHVESFFWRGPFATNRGLRLGPMATRPGSPFLAATLRIVRCLRRGGQRDLHEVFPTLWMAALLPPHRYEGARGAHTDELWQSLLRARHPLLMRHAALVDAVESAPRAERHDLRAAAIAAVAAAQPRALRLSEPGDPGFLLPPARAIDPAFRTMLTEHLAREGRALRCTQIARSVPHARTFPTADRAP